ncbi:MAG: hypothetical protein RI897_4177 [Verrucomicrobiota bacterium]
MQVGGLDDDGGEEWGAGFLVGGTGDLGVDGLDGLLADEEVSEVEPMDPEVEEHEVVDIFVGSADRPGVIEGELAIDGAELADEALLEGGAEIGEVGGPASVLVYRQFHVMVGGVFDEAFAEVEIEDERFLAEYVFSGADAVVDDLSPFLGVEGDIDDFDIVGFQEFLVIRDDGGVGIEFLLSLVRAVGVDVTDSGDIEA